MAFLGIDIASSTTRAALIDEDLHMLALANVPTHIDGTFQTTVEDVYAVAGKALAQAGFRPGAIEAMCVSVSGVVDDETGRAFSPALEWIEPMPVRVIVRKHIAAPVFLVNDAQAAALGEAYYGAGMPYDRFALVRMGNLIEIAMVMGGKPVETYDLPAQAATEGEFLLEAHELMVPDANDTLDLSGIGLGMIRSSQIMEEAQRGNAVAIHAMDWLAGRIAECVVDYTTEHAPQALIVAGATQRDQNHLGRLVTRKLAETRSAIAGIPVESAALGNDAKAFGAAIIALQRA